MFTAEEDCSLEWLTSLCNLIVAQRRIPDDWKSSILLPVFKGKRDPMECGSYRAIKLLEHAMKVIERVRKKDQRESKDSCNAVWIYAKERNYRCNLRSMADAREIWV